MQETMGGIEEKDGERLKEEGRREDEEEEEEEGGMDGIRLPVPCALRSKNQTHSFSSPLP